ncbi:MAG TPA: cytochrome c peroxidase [Kofleriaceae bacterium]|nr:cytochrome c peroxidase [Kofleriaceae bacterium]
MYKRASMPPVYQLTPATEERKFLETGVTLADTDFESLAGNFVAASQKLDEIGAQIGAETGTAAVQIYGAADRTRAQLIPFRGNPSDIKVISIAGRRKAYVPLGGDLMTPGNEVASVDLATNTVITRVKVGIHPQRVAVHPAGLIFVCNQFSNYISVIDPTTDLPLQGPKGPVEIKTEFFCTDLVFVPRNPAAPDVDEQDLYVGNGWRASVLKYGLTVVRDNLSNQVVDVVVSNPANPSPENQPAAEISGVGANPYRLSVGQDLRTLFVANNKGGEIARIDLGSNNVKRIAINGPVPDVVQANDLLLIPTTTIDRGLPNKTDPLPTQISAAPVSVKGLDGNQHIAHPGAMFDNTRAYNFEDLRNGLIAISAQLNTSNLQYFTDDISPEANFQPQQKVLQGAIPQAVVTNKAGTKAFIALSGSDVIQQVSIVGGAFRVAPGQTPLFHTDHRPYEMLLDEQTNELFVADWGGEVLEIFDATTAQRKARIDLGYATLPYPGTNIEKGELLFYNASWSNNGRKSCASCHTDELLIDGVGYANGATANTEYHKVTSNFNLMTTDSYFWNGSFATGTYAGLAGDFQTRSNCELINFGYTEGIASDPATRIGDPANRIRVANEADCHPIAQAGTVLPLNFAQTAAVIAQEHQVRDQVVSASTQALGVGALDFATTIRFTDFYSVSELRLPPNPLTYLYNNKQLDSKTQAQIDQGKTVFMNAGCGRCHDPSDSRHPFTDGLNHGRGANWAQDFVDRYGQDPRLLALLPAGIPGAMTEAIHAVTPDTSEINVHVDPIDYFIPGCFDLNVCLEFDDPALAQRNSSAETQRLEALIKVNLANADRGFVPGNVRGQPQVNTPSLRGIWYQPNFLRHGLAHSLREAILAPGHPLLQPGETGFAVDALGKVDVHGTTSKMSQADFDALNLYVQAIE